MGILSRLFKGCEILNFLNSLLYALYQSLISCQLPIWILLCISGHWWELVHNHGTTYVPWEMRNSSEPAMKTRCATRAASCHSIWAVPVSDSAGLSRPLFWPLLFIQTMGFWVSVCSCDFVLYFTPTCPVPDRIAHHSSTGSLISKLASNLYSFP